ncbi:ciliary neurotrophic factor receptor subunit alpha isoform X2 [Ascaphus truei]|uniref:ciliary neurotrophic factor receptor subunit alpha isoform X2 n=1 Tax=Ascaphus truei TaxID=8439 RepID=UPI003F5950FC
MKLVDALKYCNRTSMANPVTSACYVVLAAAVMVYAQRHGQEIKPKPHQLLAESGSSDPSPPQRAGRSPQREPHIQYERMGSDVTMRCGTMEQDAAVTWTVNGTDIDNSNLNGSSLMLRSVDLTHNGFYSCFEGSSWQLWHQTILKVGNLPKEPVLTCRSNNYPNSFYCSWHLPSPTFIPNAFNISVSHGTRQLPCERDAFPKNRCHIKYSHLFSTLKYRVTVVVTNALGKNSASISFDEFSIVKPDPPENVLAKPVHNNPRRLEVTWQNPSSWPDPEAFPLKFFLRYRPLIVDQWQHVELSDGTSHTITDAYAGKEYIIQVAAKDYEIGTWSDWSVAAHATPWTEEPKHVTTEAQKAETTTTITTTTTTTYVAPPSTKTCEPESVVGNTAVTVSWLAVLLLGPVGILLM